MPPDDPTVQARGSDPPEPPGATMSPERQAARPHRAVQARGSDPPEPPGATMSPERQAARPHRAVQARGSDPPEPPGATAVASDLDSTVTGQQAELTRQSAAQEPPGRGRSLGTDPVAWLIALVTFLAYTVISVFRYLRLDPGSWDLGIFTEYIKQAAHLHAPVVTIRGTGFNLLGDHFQPIVAL